MSRTETIQDIFGKAKNAHEDGRFEKAESLYRPVLKTIPTEVSERRISVAFNVKLEPG